MIYAMFCNLQTVKQSVMKPYFHNQQVLQNRVFTNQDIVLKVRNQGKKNGASERIRTVDSHVGNVILYQLSYTRTLKGTD